MIDSYETNDLRLQIERLERDLSRANEARRIAEAQFRGAREDMLLMVQHIEELEKEIDDLEAEQDEERETWQ
jgi:hypothetical protein